MNTERTSLFLMANLGSEMARFFNFVGHDQKDMAPSSAQRAFHIIDQLMERNDLGGGRQEVIILRSIIQDALSAVPQYAVSEEEIDSYFLPFATRQLTK